MSEQKDALGKSVCVYGCVLGRCLCLSAERAGATLLFFPSTPGEQNFRFSRVLFLMAFSGVGLLGLPNIKSWVKPCFAASPKTPSPDSNPGGDIKAMKKACVILGLEDGSRKSLLERQGQS